MYTAFDTPKCLSNARIHLRYARIFYAAFMSTTTLFFKRESYSNAGSTGEMEFCILSVALGIESKARESIFAYDCSAMEERGSAKPWHRQNWALPSLEAQYALLSFAHSSHCSYWSSS